MAKDAQVKKRKGMLKTLIPIPLISAVTVANTNFIASVPEVDAEKTKVKKVKNSVATAAAVEAPAKKRKGKHIII
jgi:hypothetical protein